MRVVTNVALLWLITSILWKRKTDMHLVYTICGHGEAFRAIRELFWKPYPPQERIILYYIKRFRHTCEDGGKGGMKER
jgi:hypothetical protein